MSHYTEVSHFCNLCLCVCVHTRMCACGYKDFSFIPLSQHMGKGLQPLIAMETHVCPSLCLSALRTDRQLVASQPRMSCTLEIQGAEVTFKNTHTHTHQGCGTTARTHTHTKTPSPRQKSLSPTFVNSFVSQQLLPEAYNSHPQKGQFSALLALCIDATENVSTRLKKKKFHRS